MEPTFLHCHRGPFRFLVARRKRTPVPKTGTHRYEWLTGTVEREDVEAEATALLTDPRDTIDYVHVWSSREDCFVGGYK